MPESPHRHLSLPDPARLDALGVELPDPVAHALSRYRAAAGAPHAPEPPAGAGGALAAVADLPGVARDLAAVVAEHRAEIVAAVDRAAGEAAAMVDGAVEMLGAALARQAEVRGLAGWAAAGPAPAVTARHSWPAVEIAGVGVPLVAVLAALRDLASADPAARPPAAG